MRAGTEAALARVVLVFGAARPHHAYLFANRRANRMKVLVHDGIGVWLAARRLNSGKFAWPKNVDGTLALSRPQFDALVLVRCPRKFVELRSRVRSTQMEIGPMKKRYTEEQIIGSLREGRCGHGWRCATYLTVVPETVRLNGPSHSL